MICFRSDAFVYKNMLKPQQKSKSEKQKQTKRVSVEIVKGIVHNKMKINVSTHVCIDGGVIKVF